MRRRQRQSRREIAVVLEAIEVALAAAVAVVAAVVAAAVVVVMAGIVQVGSHVMRIDWSRQKIAMMKLPQLVLIWREKWVLI